MEDYNVDIPYQREKVYTEKRSIAFSQDTHERLERLKSQGVEVNEWIRRIVDRALPAIEKRVGKGRQAA